MKKIVKQYHGLEVQVWCQESFKGDPYPWRFAIVIGGTEKRYGGAPNYCESKRSALKRAWWRAKWISEGNSRYTPALTLNENGNPVNENGDTI